eukprot:NODE_1647_length_884_cov_106.706587_g1289_i0.p1 GENE.NODE_1647_length_884_cov_106.706587_g1289_i0~~NODE_1647_length_884_cov_106.706587_g1289_i0.p1  ORF type:complete len:207 (-),score=37.04 NODE_1647_length_884_cov_106.706587_g1289_i0:188-808(-)
MAQPDDEDNVFDDVCQSIREATDRGDNTFNVSHTHILSVFPEDIKLLKNTVSVLHIDNNYQLCKLPPAIGDLTKLTWLNLSYNHLAELPAEIGRLKNLMRLHVNNNLLNSLPIEIWNLKQLEELLADSNQLKAVPTGVLEMPQLKKIYLDNNPLLTPEDIVEGFEEKVPPPPAVGDCSLTRQKFTQCFIHVSFHDLCGVPKVDYIH